MSKISEILKVLSSFVVLQEAGGVPFEILEPVLIRCTPEQLFRIEKCNLVNSALLNLGNHRVPQLHRLHWFSVLHTNFFELICHYQVSLSQVSGYKTFRRITTDD